jgi:hypothetical protein
LAAVRIEGGAQSGTVLVWIAGGLGVLVLGCAGAMALVEPRVLLHPVVLGLGAGLMALAGLGVWRGVRLGRGQQVLLDYDADRVAVAATLAEDGRPWALLRQVRLRQVYPVYGSGRSLALGFEVPQLSGQGTTGKAGPMRWRGVDCGLIDGPEGPVVDGLLAAARAAGCMVGPERGVFRGLWRDRVWPVSPPER